MKKKSKTQKVEIKMKGYVSVQVHYSVQIHMIIFKAILRCFWNNMQKLELICDWGQDQSGCNIS